LSAAQVLFSSLLYSGGIIAVLLLGFYLGRRDMLRRRHRDAQTLTRVTGRINSKQQHEEMLLMHSQKMEAIGRLAGGVAHDFNNLLSVVMGHTQLLMMHEKPDTPTYSSLDEINKASQRGASLTRQLLLFSRKEVCDPRIINLNSILTEMNKLLRRVIGEHISLELVLHPDLVSVKADPSLIEQVIFNLVVNSQEAMATGGKLTISTRNVNLPGDIPPVIGTSCGAVELEPGLYVMLSVADTGSGIAPEALPQIFEPFFTTKEAGRGTGLGLSTAYGIITQSRGAIIADSSLAQGSVFRFFLPVCEEVQASPSLISPQAERTACVGSETILLVEDEQGMREMVRDILKSAGYTVLEACHPAQAMSICRSHSGPLDMLLTDVVMPHFSGPTLAMQVVKTYPTIKLLFMSGYRDETITHHGLKEISPEQFLHKPFTPKELMRKVRDLLDQPAATANFAKDVPHV